VAVLFAAVTSVFVFAGTRVGEIFSERESLAAYSVDVAGSIAGVLVISLMSLLETPPPVWFAVAGIPLAILSRRPRAWIALAAVLVLSFVSVRGARFSPYYRIDIDRATQITGSPMRLSVNRDFHQYMHDLSARRLANPDLPPLTRQRLVAAEQMYRLPYFLSPQRDGALVVGAGTGNDAAAALRQGFHHVTAVEIDPRIAVIGRDMHPEQPYSDPRVRLIVNDARAFFERPRKEQKFNVVSFGLLDSHAMFSAMSSLRLDNYVYTRNAVAAAWSEVTDPGLLCISFASGNNAWMSDRLYAIVKEATGTEPVVIPHGLQNGRFYIAAKGFDVRAALTRYGIRTVSPGPQANTIRIPTDDWPYLYLKPGAIPYSYIAVLILILSTAVISVRLVFRGDGGSSFDAALFFMGAAFLLIETRGVTTLSLLFGSTWIVNSAVFTGILALAWLANEFVRRHPDIDVKWAMIALFAVLAVNFFVGPGLLLRLPLILRWLLGGVVNALPVGLAGIAFSALLRRSPNADIALGSNLLGAVVGGCAEYLSIVVGLRALVLLAVVFYLAAFLRIQARLAPAAAK
jgi:hypothetical protein